MKITVKVIPNSRNDEIKEGDSLVVRVKDPPEKNKANKKVIKLLSDHFGHPIRIVSGFTSKKKVVEF